LTTPSGKPTSSIRLARWSAVSVASSAGLSTTVFPAARAGASFQEAIRVGAFHAVIAPTTPIGSRIVYA
jgi:hypothetical protein